MDHRRIDDAAAVVDQMAAHQHSEHENPHIIVLILFSVPDSLSVDKQHVYFFAILGLNWHGLIPNPKSLRKGRGLISYSKSIWLANQVVENVRLATTVHPAIAITAIGPSTVLRNAFASSLTTNSSAVKRLKTY